MVSICTFISGRLKLSESGSLRFFGWHLYLERKAPSISGLLALWLEQVLVLAWPVSRWPPCPHTHLVPNATGTCRNMTSSWQSLIRPN
jgi:hypothetical protein